MNSIVMDKQNCIFKEAGLPLWFVVLFAALLIFFISSLAAYFYKKQESQNVLNVQQASLEQQKQQLLTQADVINTSWLRTLNPLVKNVTGGIVWSSKLQQGIMYFENLPALEARQHYQLWMYDLDSKADQRVSGGSFKLKGHGAKYMVVIQPQQKLEQPYKFELVIDQSGVDASGFNKSASHDQSATKPVYEYPLLLAQP